ncbi:MAG: HlyD family type I secretion periplasmic adaptor subunit [Verrucomicrobiales bacterium]
MSKQSKCSGDEEWSVAELKALAKPVRIAARESIPEGDVDFVQDCRTLLRRQRMGWRGIAPFITVVIVAVLVGWASIAELEEVTKGFGKVIPSKSLQLIQSLEGGILEEIYVTEGAVVEKGQPLIHIRDAIFAAHYQENLARRDELFSGIARLKAEAEGFTPLIFPKSVRDDLAKLERGLYEKKKADFEAIRGSLSERLKLAQSEEKLMAAGRENRSISPVELLHIQKEVAQLKGELATLRTKIEREAMEQFDKDKAELEVLEHMLERDKDRLDRTLIKSPVKGTVNKIHINTVGRVISSGIDIMEIVPLDDTLLIEANIRPSDIAFILPGLDVKVKFTAYDFSIYGGMDGKVERLSVDTVTNERGESFYQIRVRAERSSLGKDRRGEELTIMPGMVTEVDIMTGKKSILSYLMKPITRARERALRER